MHNKYSLAYWIANKDFSNNVVFLVRMWTILNILVLTSSALELVKPMVYVSLVFALRLIILKCIIRYELCSNFSGLIHAKRTILKSISYVLENISKPFV